jgi:hypothetical protein
MDSSPKLTILFLHSSNPIPPFKTLVYKFIFFIVCSLIDLLIYSTNIHKIMIFGKLGKTPKTSKENGKFKFSFTYLTCMKIFSKADGNILN